MSLVFFNSKSMNNKTGWITVHFKICASMTSVHLLLTDKPAIAPPVFVFQKEKAQKVSFSVTHVCHQD